MPFNKKRNKNVDNVPRSNVKPRRVKKQKSLKQTNKLKARKYAKKIVKREYAAELATMDPQKVKELHSIALKAVNKERLKKMQDKIHSGLSSVQLTSPYLPLKATVQWDFGSGSAFVRALLEVLSMEYPFLNPDVQGVAPWQFYFYCLTLVLSYLKKVGKVTGAFYNFVPPLLETFRIPQPLAKYLEYLGPASKYGAQQTTEYDYSTDLIATLSCVGYGDQMNSVDSAGVVTPVNYGATQQNLILVMQAIPSGASNTIPIDQPVFTIDALVPPGGGAPNPYQWSNWMSQAGNMDQVSNCLQRFKIPCVEASWLPGAFSKRGRAPDSSAYTFLNQANALATGTFLSALDVGIAWLNVHDDFDDDLAFLFGLFKIAQTTPAVAAKPLPLALYNYSSRYSATSLPNASPWYVQPLYVAIWLANNCDKLTRGHWKDLTVKGAKLTSFFPNVRVVGATTFATLIAHCYQQIQIMNDNAAKVGTTGALSAGGYVNDNALLWNWWALNTAATQAIQRKFNAHQVVVANCPIFASGQPNAFMLPQSNWVDPTVMDVQLPPAISKAIDAFGVCIYKGRLMIPHNSLINDTQQLAYPVPPADQYGPFYTSAQGWTVSNMTTYPYENLQTGAVFQTTPATPLNVQLDNLTLNNGISAIYLGYNDTSQVLYPWFLGGQWIQAYQKMLSSFYQTNNKTNTIVKNMEAPCEGVLGEDSALIAEINPNYNQIESTPLVPNNLQAVGGTALPVQIVRFPMVGLTNQKLDNEPNTLKTVADCWVQASNQPVAQSDTQNRRTVLALANFVNAVPLIQSVNPVTSGMFNTALKSGNAVTSLLAQLCFNTIHPDSEFAKQKELIEKAKNSFGQMIPVNKKKVMERLTTGKAYMSELSKLTGSAFGYKDRVPSIAASALGTMMGKGMSDAAASTLAVIDSSSQITASNSTAPQDPENPKHKRMKLDGRRIKKISKALIGTTKKVASGIDDAIKGVSHIADVVGKGVDTLGSVAL